MGESQGQGKNFQRENFQGQGKHNAMGLTLTNKNNFKI